MDEGMTVKKERKERKGEEQGRQDERKGKCVCWTALSLASEAGLTPWRKGRDAREHTNFLHPKLFLFWELVPVSNLFLCHKQAPRPGDKSVLPEVRSPVPTPGGDLTSTSLPQSGEGPHTPGQLTLLSPRAIVP